MDAKELGRQVLAKRKENGWSQIGRASCRERVYKAV